MGYMSESIDWQSYAKKLDQELRDRMIFIGKLAWELDLPKVSHSSKDEYVKAIQKLKQERQEALEQIDVMQEIYQRHKLASEDLAKDPLVNANVNIPARMSMAAEALKEFRDALTETTEEASMTPERRSKNRELLERSYPLGEKQT